MLPFPGTTLWKISFLMVQCVTSKWTISAKTFSFATYSQLSRESASLARTISAWTPLAEHIKKCPHMEVKCNLCGENFKRQDHALHEDACTMAEIVCECGNKFPRKDQCEHVAHRCDFTKMSCPLNCGQMIERYVDFHIQHR